MRGIVKAPVVATLAEVLPLMVPIKALDTTAIFAGPPLRCPVRAIARSLKNWEVPVELRNAPKRMKR